MTSPTTPQIAELATQLRLACMRISRRVRFESADGTAPHQFSVLVRLAEKPRTAGELADIERVSAPSMTRTVGGLVDRGLVSRASDPADGRCVILSLTEAGAAAVEQIRAARNEWMAARVAELDEADREVLRRAARILQAVAEK